MLQEDENMADVYEIPTESEEGDAAMAMLEEQ